MKVAVIGGGISGLGAAWLLQNAHDVTLIEAEGRLGGHANTVEVDAIDRNGARRNLPVDTGFIVYNERNYPNLIRLFEHLDVPTEASNMSFSVSIDGGALEYAGSASGLFAQWRNVFRPGHWRMVRDIMRFYREAEEVLEAGPAARSITLGDYLAQAGYGEAFIFDHLLPMGAAIWSASPRQMLDFPAASFIQFFANHGLLDYRDRPRWRTVTGGSRAYVSRLIDDFRGEIITGRPVAGVRRVGPVRQVLWKDGSYRNFDAVVLACHADQALQLLGTQATPEEREIIGSFGYEANRAVLHSDPQLMPRRRSCWASWSYLARRSSDIGSRVSVSYWMNRLQNLETDTPVIVSLNPLSEPDPALVMAEFSYDHPQFDLRAMEAQRRLPEIQGANGVWFCGSYCGYGFHEDGLQSGMAVAAALGAPAPWANEVRPASPAAWNAAPAAWRIAAE